MTDSLDPAKPTARRPAHPCSEPGCADLARAGESRCKAHEKLRQREYDAHRRPERHAFYHSREWRALSRLVLKEQPYCACGAKTRQADHILSIKARPDLALDRGNVVARCRPCHSRKTAKEDGRWGKSAEDKL